MSYAKRLLERRRCKEPLRPEMKWDAVVSYKERLRAQLLSEYGKDWVREYWKRRPWEFLQDGEDEPGPIR